MSIGICVGNELIIEKYTGSVLFIGKESQYEDSVVYVYCWNEEQKLIREKYDINKVKVEIDATDEVMKKYLVWKQQEDRKLRLTRWWKERIRISELSRKLKLSIKQIYELENIMNCENIFYAIEMYRLGKLGNHKTFINMVEKIIKWVENMNNKDVCPLSNKEVNTFKLIKYMDK